MGLDMMGLDIKRLPGVGVEVAGLELWSLLSGPESDTRIGELRRRVMDEGLLLFRDQPLDPEAQVALGQHLGSLEQLDLDAGDDAPKHMVIGNVGSDGRTFADDDPRMKLITINEGWHTDSSFREIPASFSIFAAPCHSSSATSPSMVGIGPGGTSTAAAADARRSSAS